MGYDLSSAGFSSLSLTKDLYNLIPSFTPPGRILFLAVIYWQRIYIKLFHPNRYSEMANELAWAKGAEQTSSAFQEIFVYLTIRNVNDIIVIIINILLRTTANCLASCTALLLSHYNIKTQH